MGANMKKILFFALLFVIIFSSGFLAFADFNMFNLYDSSDLSQNNMGTINGFAIFADNNTVVQNNVNGTALVFGNTVTVKSKIDGDLYVFGNNVAFSGEVSGNIYIFGNSVTINGKADKDAVVFAKTADFSASGILSRDVIALAQTVSIAGAVERDAYIAATNTSVSGNLNRDLKASSRNINIESNAKINGKMSYYSSNEAQIASGARIGQIDYSEAPVKQASQFNYSKILWKIIGAAVSTLLIWLFITFFAPLFNKRSKFVLLKKPVRTALSGLIAVICLPIIAVIIMVTILGLGVGAIILGLYVGALYLTFAVTMNALTEVLVQKLSFIKPFHKNVWYTLALAVIVKALTYVPYLGAIIIFAYPIIGFGLLISFIFKEEII